ncbi:MAG: SLC13 family permease [Hyphomicrobiales bacterium]|nr:SLC13 family permease [Hyphomicrobiales bacterium]
MHLPALQMWFTFAVIAVAVGLLVSERVRLEVTCAGIILTFLIFFHFFPVAGPDGGNLLAPERLLAGFANPALIAILALLVIGQGLFQTGALEAPTRTITHLAGRHAGLVPPLVLVVAAVISAFMNNTPVVVMFLPILGAIAGRLRMSPSKVLMPLSFVAILGGMTTLIGSSTNLLVADVAVSAGLPRLGFFDITVPGVVMAAIGLVYVLFVMPRLLAPRATMAEEVADGGGKQFIAQIEVSFEHPLVGTQSVSGMFPSLKNMTVRLVQRGEHAFLPPFEDVTLRPGDVVIVAATRQVLAEALKAPDNILAAVPGESEAEPAGQRDGGDQLMLAEAVIAPGSRMIGRTVEQSGLHAETGCIVLGIQRRSRMIRMRLSDIRLESGDVILTLGLSQQVSRLRLSRDLLLLERSAAELPMTERASRALVIFAAVVLAAAIGLVPIVIAALTGAFAMVATGCLNVRQAARAFDRQIYLLIAASLAMALPLDATGGAMFLAHGVVDALGNASSAVLLSAIFALVAVLTNLLSNNATAVLFTPIAASAAAEVGAEPLPFVIAVIFAANCSFASPIGYQTNLLVMGPGHYRFGDFLRAGTPLVILIWIAFSVFAPWYYGLS